MKIHFLEIETEKSWALTSVGPGYIGSFIKAHGHEAVLSRVSLTQNAETIIERIKKTAPDILGLSLITRQWRRAAQLIGLIRKKIDVPVIAGGLHPTFAPEAVLEADGVESGSRHIRCDVLNRHAENQRFKDAFRWSKAAGILATANYMIGLPYETREDIEQTLALDRELEPDDFGCFVFYPYPGTHLHDVCRQNGSLPENYLDLPVNDRQSILNLPDLTCDDIEHYYGLFKNVRRDRYHKRYGGALNGEARGSSGVSHVRIADG